MKALGFNTQTATKHWNNGLIDNEIEKEMKLQHGKIGAWRRKNGLPSNAGIFNWDKGERSGNVTRVVE